MKDFKEFKKLVEDNIKLFVKEENNPSLDVYTKGYKAQVQNRKVVFDFVEKAISGLDEANIKGMISQYGKAGADEINKTRLMFFLNTVKDGLSVDKINVRQFLQDKINQYNSKEPDEIINDLFDSFTSSELGKDVKEKVIATLAVNLINTNHNCETVEGFTNVCETLSAYVDLDEVAKQVNTEVNTFLDVDDLVADKPTHEKQINDIMKTFIPDEESKYKETFLDANSILVEADDNYLEQSGTFLEHYGSICDNVRLGKIKSYVDKTPKYAGKAQIDSGVVVFKNSVSIDEKSELIKENFNEKIGVNNSTLEGINEIIDLIENNGIYSRELDENHPNPANGYRFSMTLLVEKKYKLQDAVKRKNKEEIFRSAKEFRRVEKIYDTILDKIQKVTDPQDVMSNNGSSREADVPAKYRKNGIAVSKLNALFQVIKICRRNDLDPKEFFKNPLKGFTDVIKNNERNYTLVDNVKNAENTYQILDSIRNAREDANHENVNVTLGIEFSRVMDCLGCIFGKDINGIEKLSKIQMCFKDVVSNGLAISGRTEDGIIHNPYEDGEEAEELLKDNVLDIIIGGKEVNFKQNIFESEKFLDIETLDPIKKTFDVNAYLNNEKNQYKIAENLVSATDYDNERGYQEINLSDTLSEAITKFKATEYEKSEVVGDIITKLEKGKTISNTDRRNLKYEKEYNAIVDSGLQTNIDSGLNKYLAVKDDYNSRNFLAKIFFSSVRRQSRMLDKMKNDLIECGIKKNELNEIVDANAEERQTKISYFKELFAVQNNPEIEINQERNERVFGQDENLSIIDDVSKVQTSEFKKAPEKNELRKDDIEINTNIKID